MQCKNMVVGTVYRNGHKCYYLHPCGQCLACRINDCRSWFVRSFFELKKEERPFHYFLTLTYDDEHLPDDKLCNKPDLKKFLNNLNTSFGLHLRYFATSDYGSVNGRAHYHAILLSEKKIYQKQVERIWKKGFVLLKPCNFQNIKYTLRYTVKKKPFEKGDKTNFRLISKGWGNNVATYYTGQEFFIIDGKKYGITPYLASKLGFPKKETFYTQYMDSLIMHPEYRFVGGSCFNNRTELDELIDFKEYLAKIKRTEVI